jgi:hypothetical protein
VVPGMYIVVDLVGLVLAIGELPGVGVMPDVGVMPGGRRGISSAGSCAAWWLSFSARCSSGWSLRRRDGGLQATPKIRPSFAVRTQMRVRLCGLLQSAMEVIWRRSSHILLSWFRVALE